PGPRSHRYRRRAWPARPPERAPATWPRRRRRRRWRARWRLRRSISWMPPSLRAAVHAEHGVVDGDVGLALAVADLDRAAAARRARLDLEREVDAGDLLVVAEVGNGEVLAPAQDALGVDPHGHQGVDVDEVGELVAALLGQAQLVGGRAVDVLGA